MPKFLIDASSGKSLTVYMDGQRLERVLRIDGMRSGGEDELAEITLTFSTDEVNYKDVDGKTVDILNGYSEVRDV